MSAAAAALLVVALLGAAVALVRRRHAATAPAPAELAFRAPLAKDCGIAVVRWRGRELLVGYGHGGATLLASEPSGDAA